MLLNLYLYQLCQLTVIIQFYHYNMDAKDNAFGNINRVANTHFFLRPVLVSALKNQIITEEGRAFAGGANTFYEFWINSFNDRFFDMGTFIRLGTEIENGLKYYYMEKKGHQNLVELKNDPKYSLNIFQRVLPWTQNSAIDIYRNELNIDLTANSKLVQIQEIMLCRHLFAHNSGLLTDDFIDKYLRLTNIDITTLPAIQNYPSSDTYFFDPLQKLNKFIEDAKRFVRKLP